MIFHFVRYQRYESTVLCGEGFFEDKPSPKSSPDQKLTVTEMFHKSSIDDFVPLVWTAKRDKPLEWRPFWPSQGHPLLLALGQQSETRLRACGLPTYFCLLRMLKPRTGSPTVVGLMWAGCRGIQTSRLWRQRITSGEGRTTTPFRVDVFVVLFNCPCHDVVRQSGPKKKSFDLSHMTPWPRSCCPLLMSVLQNIFFKLKR